MERMTAERNGVMVYVGPGCEYDTGMIPAELQSGHVRQVLNRLAAYEKTGLEPEEVYTLCSMDRRAKMDALLRLEASTAEGMTLAEIISSLEAQANDIDDFVNEYGPDCPLRNDATAIRAAVDLLRKLEAVR